MTIQEFLEDHQIDYKEAGAHHHARTGWIQIDCPFCGEGSGSYHLGINLENQYANCWRCGSLELTAVLSSATGLPQRSLYNLLDKPEQAAHSPSKSSRTSNPLTIPDGLEPLSGPYTRYLERRGFDPVEIEKLWDIKATGMYGHLAWRIWIPIVLHNKVVSWTTRTIGSEKHKAAKYVSARPEDEIVEHKHLLYGEDFARHSIIVVEGPTDAWAIGPGAVAVMGLNYSQEQVAGIATYPVRTICFDEGVKAQSVAEKLAGELSCFPGQTHSVELESGNDPADAEDWEIEILRTKYLL